MNEKSQVKKEIREILKGAKNNFNLLKYKIKNILASLSSVFDIKRVELIAISNTLDSE